MSKIKKTVVAIAGVMTLLVLNINNVFAETIPSSNITLPSGVGRTAQSPIGMLIICLLFALVIIFIVAVSEHNRKKVRKEMQEMCDKENNQENK